MYVINGLSQNTITTVQFRQGKHSPRPASPFNSSTLVSGYENLMLFGDCMQSACVENALDLMVASLRRDPNRKFVFAEMVK